MNDTIFMFLWMFAGALIVLIGLDLSALSASITISRAYRQAAMFIGALIAYSFLK